MPFDGPSKISGPVRELKPGWNASQKVPAKKVSANQPGQKVAKKKDEPTTVQ